MSRAAVHGQRGGADAVDAHAELLQEEAQVLDHVVRAGVADHGDAVVAGGGEQGVLGDGVAALGEHDRPGGGDRPVHGGVVAALGGLDLQAEGAQRGHVRLDGAGAEVAAAGVRQLEDVLAVHQRAQEHDDRAGTTGRLLVDAVQVELGRRDDLEVVVVVEPAGLHAHAGEHLEEPVDLLDARDPAQRRTPAVEQGGAEQRDAGVLGGLDVDGAGQRRRAGDPQVRGTGAEGDDLGVEGLADAGEHLQRQVLVAALDPVHGALAGGEHVGELLLGPATVLAGVADQVADPGEVVVGHAGHFISHVRYPKPPIPRVAHGTCRRRRACHGQRGSRVPGFD